MSLAQLHPTPTISNRVKLELDLTREQGMTLLSLIELFTAQPYSPIEPIRHELVRAIRRADNGR